MPDPDIEIIDLPGLVLHLSAEHFPALLVTWFGVPRVELVERYSQWLLRMAARAEAEGTKLAILDNTASLDGLPGPEVRRAMATAMEGLTTSHPGVLLGAVVVMTNPFMRAAVTMVLAISRQEFEVKPQKDLGQGVAHVLSLLERAGIARPAGLDPQTYRAPERPR